MTPLYSPPKPSHRSVFMRQSTTPLYTGFVDDCVCRRTLSVSNGCPTRVTAIPPEVPAVTSRSMLQRKLGGRGDAVEAAVKLVFVMRADVGERADEEGAGREDDEEELDLSET